MTPDEIWRSKSDADVLAAADRLAEYTEIGQRLILAELQRRQLSDAGAPNSSASPAVPETTVRGRPDADRPATRNPVARLWRGEFSLPMSYWVWGVLGNRVSGLAVNLVASSTDSPGPTLAVGAVSIVYFVIVTVGIWRSSSRYPGRRLWRDLARVSVALALVWTIAGLLASAR